MNKEIDKILINALEEDMPLGDITTDNILDDNHVSTAYFIAKEDGIISGLEVVERCFHLIGGRYQLTWHKTDGQSIQKGDEIGIITGATKTILKGERVGLNIMQRMSGIATMAHNYQSMCDGNTKILDTRKTTPNFRYLEKMAVRHGGATNHRYSLSDQVMLKDNHIEAMGSITKAVDVIYGRVNCLIEVEVETFEQYIEAVNTKCDIIMLDNMSNELMDKCIKYDHSKKLEASGNMTLKRIKEVSKLGVDFISVGALTHSVEALDISLKFKR